MKTASWGAAVVAVTAAVAALVVGMAVLAVGVVHGLPPIGSVVSGSFG